MDSVERGQTANGQVTRIFRKYGEMYIATAICVEKSTFVLKKEQSNGMAELASLQVHLPEKEPAAFAQSLLTQIAEAELAHLDSALQISAVFDVYGSEGYFEPLLMAVNDLLQELGLSSRYTGSEVRRAGEHRYRVFKNGQLVHHGLVLAYSQPPSP